MPGWVTGSTCPRAYGELIQCSRSPHRQNRTLRQQAEHNTKEQFSNSPDLTKEIMNAIIDALVAHSTMSEVALGSEQVRGGLKDVLLGPGQLWEDLRKKEGGNTMFNQPDLLACYGESYASTMQTINTRWMRDWVNYSNTSCHLCWS